MERNLKGNRKIEITYTIKAVEINLRGKIDIVKTPRGLHYDPSGSQRIKNNVKINKF